MDQLEIDEIVDVIKEGEPKFITEAKKEGKRLNTLINGEDVPEYLEQSEGYENDDEYLLRQKFAGNVKHVFSNLFRPVDKVFSANGGSKIFGTNNSKTAEKKLLEKLSDVSDGLSITAWIKNIQANKYYSDPNGVVFFEWDTEDTYPEIKTIDKIRNYSTSGRTVNWILFQPERRVDNRGITLSGEYYRFVDSNKDYTFHKDGDRVTLLEDEVYEVPWDKCPAIRNSDIINYKLTHAASPADNVVDLSDKYLRGQSTRNIYEQLLMYPMAWMYAPKCDSCKGSGEVDGVTCTSCNGTGQSMSRDVSKILLLSTPKNSDSPTIAPNVAGFSQVELEPFRESRDELKWVGDLMNFTMWGSTHETAENETATAAFLDLQPVHDRQGQFTDAFEDVDKRMTDFIGEFYLQESYDANGTSINWGRRYLMESPDKIWTNYIEAKEKNAPKTSLNHLLSQYYQSEFMNDAQSLAIKLKAMKVEPFIHKSDEEIMNLNIDRKDFISKVYFNEWWVSLDDMDVLTKSSEVLKEQLNKFITDKVKYDEKSESLQGENSQ